jgi:DNA repair photolyase
VAILENTNWDIRLLSKGVLLPRVAKDIQTLLGDRVKYRLIYGVSTGTLDDTVARAIEPDTPKPSHRLKSQRQLQATGCRTFGMVCPSLPMAGPAYEEFSRDIMNELQVHQCASVCISASTCGLR